MGMRRIVAERIVTEEGVGYTVRPCFPPPERYRNSMLPHGLWPPHYGRSYGDQDWDSPVRHVSEGDLRLLDKVSGCYRGTRGEMPQGWLVKGNDLSSWGQSRCSSQRTGRPSTGRRAAG